LSFRAEARSAGGEESPSSRKWGPSTGMSAIPRLRASGAPLGMTAAVLPATRYPSPGSRRTCRGSRRFATNNHNRRQRRSRTFVPVRGRADVRVGGRGVRAARRRLACRRGRDCVGNRVFTTTCTRANGMIPMATNARRGSAWRVPLSWVRSSR